MKRSLNVIKCKDENRLAIRQRGALVEYPFGMLKYRNVAVNLAKWCFNPVWLWPLMMLKKFLDEKKEKKINLNIGNNMKNQQIMKKMILSMFESKPGLREGDCLPPRWLLQSEIVNLNEQEKYTLESAFNELRDDELIEISKVDNSDDTEEQKISITQAGVEYISKNKPVKKIIKKQNKNQIVSDLLKDILPDD